MSIKRNELSIEAAKAILEKKTHNQELTMLMEFDNGYVFVFSKDGNTKSINDFLHIDKETSEIKGLNPGNPKFLDFLKALKEKKNEHSTTNSISK